MKFMAFSAFTRRSSFYDLGFAFRNDPSGRAAGGTVIFQEIIGVFF
jgi:hypothetical protein